MQNKIIVTSSSELSNEIRTTLEAKLKAKIGDYGFQYKVDSKLIAGFIVNFGDTQYNYDLLSEIQNVENQIL
jgi:F0F1-type ATP synthase delta subunit